MEPAHIIVGVVVAGWAVKRLLTGGKRSKGRSSRVGGGSRIAPRPDRSRDSDWDRNNTYWSNSTTDDDSRHHRSHCEHPGHDHHHHDHHHDSGGDCISDSGDSSSSD